MRIFRIVLTAIFLVGLTACATPPQVKELSTAQIAYFDTAIKAVRAQSEALILAAERIRNDAEARIKARTARSRTDIRDALSPPPGQSPPDPTTVDDLLKGLESAKESEQQNIAKLEAHIGEIKARVAQLNSYIVKMKDVQVALNAYIQSEKAGEGVLTTVLKHPTVNDLLGTVSATLPKIAGTTDSLRRLLENLPRA
ncbi:hypothetical protein [Nisaea sp.]|uniref:hypothetical protein n=1 Tax=Nisaea sp. TaxID=2024842 RepID=UPI0032ED093D